MHVWSGSARLTTISRSKETNPLFWKAWSSIFRIGANRILSRRLLRTTDGSKRERSHHKTERLSRFSSCGPSVRHRAAPHEQKEQSEFSRSQLRPHQPHNETSRTATHSASQPRPLGHRELPLHDR